MLTVITKSDRKIVSAQYPTDTIVTYYENSKVFALEHKTVEFTLNCSFFLENIEDFGIFSTDISVLVPTHPLFLVTALAEALTSYDKQYYLILDLTEG